MITIIEARKLTIPSMDTVNWIRETRSDAAVGTTTDSLTIHLPDVTLRIPMGEWIGLDDQGNFHILTVTVA